MKIENQKGSWVFITPIFNLTLKSIVKEEFRIDRVTFISAQKLLKIKNRLGIDQKVIKELQNKWDINKYFSSFKTFAVLRMSGAPADIKAECFKIVRDELMILATSQLYFQNRSFTGFLGFAGENDFSSTSNLFLESKKKYINYGQQLTRSPLGLDLDESWYSYHKQFFFFKLLKIIRPKKSFSKEWREEIKRALIFIGKSVNTPDIASAFLWNMIALEIFLTHQGDAYKTVLPKRIEYLSGWHNRWKPDKYEENIKRVYTLRSAYVHDGNSTHISKADLIFTDKLIFNVVWNIVNNISYFGSKNGLIEFAKNHQARSHLGYKRLKKPKFYFADKKYSQKDLINI